MEPSVLPPEQHMQHQPYEHHPAPKQPLWRSKRVLLIAGVAVLVLAGAGYWLSRSKSATNIPTSTVAIDSLAKAKLTAAEVAKLDKTETFFAYFMNAAQQKKMVTTTEDVDATTKEAATGSDFYKVGFDYDTKKSVFAWDAAYGGTLDQDRCYGDTVAYRHHPRTEWSTGETDEHSPCQVGEHQDYFITDGFNAGGLSATQAQAFVGHMREHEGLITVKSLELTEHNGKQYLHFSANLTPIHVNGTNYGAQWLMFAFKKTGLDPSTWPYVYRGAGGDGIAIEYYVDPTTKLPVYGEFLATPHKDDNGNDLPRDNYSFARVSYQFGVSTFDASPANPAPLKLDW